MREPVDVHGLAGDLSKTRFADIAKNPDTLTAFGVGIGRQMVRGGTLLDQVRGHLFSRASGNFGALDGVIVVRDQPEDMGPVQRGRRPTLESGLMSGIVATKAPAVGVETSTAEDSSVSFFQGNDLSSVDDVDLVAGRLATVFALLGAEGSFGVKGSADRLLPDLSAADRRLAPAPGAASDLGRLPGRDRGGAARRPGRGAGPARRRAGAGELPRGGRSPSRSGRCWRRRRWSRWRRSPSSTTAATSTCSTPNCGAGSPTCSAIAFLGFLDDSLGRGRARPARRAAGAATPGRCARGGSRPARSRRSARWPWPPTSSPGAASNRGATSPTSPCWSSPPTPSTCSTCGPGGPRRGWRCSASGSASAPGRWRRSSCSGSSPARSRSAPGSRCASGRCSATPAPTWSGRSPASGC